MMLRYLLVASFVAGTAILGQDRRSLPLDPIDAVVGAFRSSPIVALGEGGHGNEQGHALRLALLRDPRFAEMATDIVVEFGNARYQDLVDRFVGGADVPTSDLRKVWQDTSQLQPVWDVPIYEAFFRAVRMVNESRPIGQRIRVLLGDPPIDWSRVTTFQDVSARCARRATATAIPPG